MEIATWNNFYIDIDHPTLNGMTCRKWSIDSTCAEIIEIHMQFEPDRGHSIYKKWKEFGDEEVYKAIESLHGSRVKFAIAFVNLTEPEHFFEGQVLIPKGYKKELFLSERKDFQGMFIGFSCVLGSKIREYHREYSSEEEVYD